MNPTPRVPPEQLVESMKEDMERYAKEVMEAVNQAPDGEWIAGSEERVRDLSAEMRRLVFERAVQRGGSRFSPLRTIRQPENGWPIRAGNPDPS